MEYIKKEQASSSHKQNKSQNQNSSDSGIQSSNSKFKFSDIPLHSPGKIKWGVGTEYLQIENLQKIKTFKIPSIYESQLKKIKELESEVEILAENSASGSASYSYDEKKQKGIIKVGMINEDYDDDVKKSVLKSKIIAMTHEMQHAIDDLKKGSPQQGRLRRDGDWYDKIMSELNAHAVQAIAGNEIIASGEKISQNDEMLSKGFNKKEFEAGGTMFNKLKSYFSLYKASASTGLNEKDPEKARAEQVTQFLFLNWGEVERLIAQVEDSKTAALTAHK
jgi:hypothetical protein